MNKGELVDVLAKKADLSKKDAKLCLDTLTDEITKALTNKEEVRLTGFGKFTTSDRKARKGRNPQTGEEIQIPARTVPKFKAGKNLKEAVK
ncbi:MAG: HU family DNA-binding protein [Candidatus Paceibacterota bacterium]